MRPKTIPRRALIAWLQAEPGLTTRELAVRAGFLQSYMRERMCKLEDDGFVRRELLKDTASARQRVCWFVLPDHPPLGRKTKAVGPAPESKPRRQRVVRPSIEVPTTKIIPAPAHDVGIVAQALAGLPPLQSAWMAGRASA